jgi:inner membrane protein
LDSISQAALGAAVGVAVMGRTRPMWQAALAGAVVGTLPDLDVLLDKGDEIRNMVLHRAETHAIFWQALASPFIAILPAALTRTPKLFGRWWLMVALALFTHSLLDAMTVYGTRIGLPFTDHPFGLGSLFIIDPLYTLPLLVGLLMGLAWRGALHRRWNLAGLVLSSLYAGWSVAAQAHVTERAMTTPEAQGVGPDRILVTPTPFNTILWRVVLLREDSYDEAFISLLDPLVDPARPIRFESLPRGSRLERRTADFADANLIREFSKGFYALSDDGQQVRITDLRMGQYPYYAFSFVFALHQSEPLRATQPIRLTDRMPFGKGVGWLWLRLQGHDLPPPRPAR